MRGGSAELLKPPTSPCNTPAWMSALPPVTPSPGLRTQVPETFGHHPSPQTHQGVSRGDLPTWDPSLPPPPTLLPAGRGTPAVTDGPCSQQEAGFSCSKPAGAAPCWYSPFTGGKLRHEGPEQSRTRTRRQPRLPRGRSCRRLPPSGGPGALVPPAWDGPAAAPGAHSPRGAGSGLAAAP